MKCPMCGTEFSETEAANACSGCSFFKGCELLRCPGCAYEMPREPQWLTKLMKLWQKKDSDHDLK